MNPANGPNPIHCEGSDCNNGSTRLFKRKAKLSVAVGVYATIRTACTEAGRLSWREDTLERAPYETIEEKLGFRRAFGI